MIIITSRANPLVKHYRELVRSKTARKEDGTVTCEGAKLTNEALLCGVPITAALVTEKAAKKYEALVSRLETVTEVTYISEEIALYISETEAPQGVFVIIRPKLPEAFDAAAAKIGDRFILLEDIRDPGNVGTIIRSCDAFGIDGLILSPHCADAFSPKVLRSAMGSAFRLAMYQCELPGAVGILKENGHTVSAALLDDKAERLGSFRLPEKYAVVIGNEGSGITKELAALCTSSVYIPMQSAESLNASVAASVIAWEMSKK